MGGYMNSKKLKFYLNSLILGLFCFNSLSEAHCSWHYQCVKAKNGICDSSKDTQGFKLIVPSFCGERDPDGTIVKYCCLDLSQEVV